MQLLFAACHAD